ncbi:MAG: hypothetical protein HYY84_09940 [Deltaproteobacteria bacterium]|nr:hypothetical protein [Deltaproteobacteria bacterium]
MDKIVLAVTILMTPALNAFASHTLPFATLKWSGGYSPVKSAMLEMFAAGTGVHTTTWHNSSKPGKISVEHRWRFGDADVKSLKGGIKSSGICSVADGTVFGAGRGVIIMDAGTVEIKINMVGCKKTVSYNPASGKDKMPEGLKTLQQALDKLSTTATGKVIGMPGCK